MFSFDPKLWEMPMKLEASTEVGHSFLPDSASKSCSELVNEDLKLESV